MLTEAFRFGCTVTAIKLEVAGEPEIQFSFEVITQVIASLLFNVVLLNIALFVPAFVPFTFH